MTNFAQDMKVKEAWGIKTLTEWNRAPEKQRAYWREHVTDAPNFKDNT